jgi:gentisate 1,2-dioxygenase
MNSKVFELNKLLSELDDQGGYFIDFTSTKGIQAVIRLHPGEIDTQGPHTVNEVYYVIEGNGFIRLDGKIMRLDKAHPFLFLLKPNTFHGNKQDLVIFYAVGGRS